MPLSAPQTTGLELLRRILASVLVAFVLWLLGNSLVTGLSPRMTPWVQAAMFSHRDIGVAFLAFLVLYLPMHILAIKGFSLESVKTVAAPVRGLVFLALVYSLLTSLWEISPILSIPVFALALAVFEVTLRNRSRLLRFLDLLLAVALTVYALHSTRDGLIRLLVLSLGCYCVYRIFTLLLRLLRRGRGEASGSILVFAAIFLALFSVMMVGGTNSGKYSRFLPVMDVLHYYSSYAFLGFLGVHLARVGRRHRFARSLRTLLSLPALALTLLVFGLWEARSIHAYQPYTTPIVDAADARPVSVSAYTNLRGYYLEGRESWYEIPTRTCGASRCHPELADQHDLSAHGRAFENEVFKLQLMDFIAEKGRAAGDYCLACHAPLAVIQYPGDSQAAGEIDLMTTSDPAFQIGVGCVVCHRAAPEKDTSKFGNASLVIKPLWLEPERYLGEDTAEGQEIHRRLIHAANPLHNRTYHIAREDADFICAACHVVRLPGSFSCDGRERKVSDQFTSFRQSPYGKAGLTCASCHQQRFATYEIAYNTVAHNYLGSGTSLPYGESDSDRRLRDISLGFLRGLGDITLETKREELPPCLGDVEGYRNRYLMLPQRGPRNPFEGTNGGLTFRPVLETSLSVGEVSDRSLEVVVTTRNQCSGHTFPSGGGLKAYLEVKAYDEGGRLVARHGGLGADGMPLDLETSLGGRSADAQGRVIRDRRFWNACTRIYQRRLEPDESVQHRVVLEVDAGARPREIEAAWYYLRPEYFRNLEMSVHSDVFPVEIGKAKERVASGG